MDNMLKIRFEGYLFGRYKPYQRIDKAILDSDCFELAKQIIVSQDSFALQIKNSTKEQKLEYYEKAYQFLVDKIGENSRLVEDIQAEITALRQGFLYARNDGRSYADDLIRIRAVFGLYGAF